MHPLVSEPPKIPVVDQLHVLDLAPNNLFRYYLRMVQDSIGRWISLPVMIARGAHPGAVFGLTAAVHGNELNGLPIIHRLFRELDLAELRGTIVAIPVVNIPGYQRNRREYRDGKDLNRLMPGQEHGNEAQVYAHRFVSKIVHQLHYLVDLHTASFGRVNSLYVRADMRDPTVAAMARLVGAQIIVHNEGGDGTLRSAASDAGVHAITVEVGDPNRFQRGLIRSSGLGILAILEHLQMLPAFDNQMAQNQLVHSQAIHSHSAHGHSAHSQAIHSQAIHSEEVHSEEVHSEEVHSEEVHSQAIHGEEVHSHSVPPSAGHTTAAHTTEAHQAVECSSSYWMYTDAGGVLEVLPQVATMVTKGEVVARLSNVFGQRLREYRAPDTGIVVGKSNNPVAHTGSRILHLGIPSAQHG